MPNTVKCLTTVEEYGTFSFTRVKTFAESVGNFKQLFNNHHENIPI